MRRLIRAVALVVLGLVLLPYVLTPFYSSGHPVSTLMIGRYLTGETVTRKWVDLDEMSEALPRSVVAAEDAKFCFHHGIDWDSVRNIIEDAQDGEVARGGSTITQQVAKNLFLWPGRSVVRKVIEFPLAMWIDLVLSKKRILELYLNVAELGPADGPVKRAIFGENSARMYRYEIKKAAWRDDRFAALKTDYERRGRDPSNLRYGFVVPS